MTLIGRPAAIGLGLLATIWIIRYLGPDRYGIYLVVFTLVTILDQTFEVSLFAIGVREIAKSSERVADWVGALTLVRGSIGIIITLGILGISFFLDLDADALDTVRLGALVFLINSFRSPIAYFRALLLVHWELSLLSLTRAAELGLVILISGGGGGVAALMGAKVLASALFLVSIWLVMLWRFQVALRTGLGLIRALVLPSAPLGLIAILVLVRTKADILLIGRLLGTTAAGLFGAVAQVPDFGSAASGLLLTTVAPLLARNLGNADARQFQAVLQRVFDGLVMILPGVAAVGCLLAGPLLRIGFGEDYAPVIPDLRVLIWVAGMIPIAELLAITGVTLNLQGQLLKVELVSVGITLAGNFFLLGLAGTIAAAWIRLLLYLFGLVLTYAIIRGNSPYRLSLRRLPRIGLATLLAAAATEATLAVNPLLAAAVGLSTYVIAVFLLLNKNLLSNRV
jgi:O-antigen/teichoic acid export membrane protein